MAWVCECAVRGKFCVCWGSRFVHSTGVRRCGVCTLVVWFSVCGVGVYVFGNLCVEFI